MQDECIKWFKNFSMFLYVDVITRWVKNEVLANHVRNFNRTLEDPRPHMLRILQECYSTTPP